ncbi:MAG: hypothetical protein PVJ49_17890 [Acidobacteriota bacterium]|jgi:hypothetical protein
MAARLTRRRFVRVGGVGVGAALAGLLPEAAARAAMQSGHGHELPRRAAGELSGIPPWAFDVDGNGIIDEHDRAHIAAAVGTQRGVDPVPLEGYDYRADLFGRGSVTTDDLDAFDAEAIFGPAPPRPVVMCWHYGWYHPTRRQGEATTTTYLGGDYLSDDALVAERFHALKNEFGITADLLSWIDPSIGFEPTLGNYDRGYFAAPGVATRRFGWLYETAINLGSSAPMSLAPGTGQRERLVENFRQMALRMVDPTTGGLYGNVLQIDGRPVVYLFASHLLGTSVLSLIDVVRALDEARRVFIEAAGVAPYLIGDESPFLEELELLDPGRRLRATFCDAVTRYHHYDENLVAAFALGGPVHLGGAYLDRVLGLERRAIAAFAGVRNRFTGAPVLVIPSSAAGFAKAGFPTLLSSRGDYERLLRATRALAEQHRATLAADSAGAAIPPVAPAIVGSWNEEFEGHAVFPVSRSEALVRGTRDGFEWPSAIKQVYGSSSV